MRTGQYRIESLQPGTYTVTFTLAGFSTLKRDDVVLSGTGVIKIDADMKVGGVAETVTVTGETPVVDVQSTKREVTLDNETMRNLPGVRSYSYLLTAVPGLQSNITDVNTGPVFAIFPVHGGRGVESRLTVEGLNISNPPGGNQPPNYTADIGNSSEVTVMTAGGLGEFETAGVQMNIVPKQGGNNLSGLFAASGFSKGMQSNNYSVGSAGARRGGAEPDVPRVRRQRGGRRPDHEGQALVLHERPRAGVAPQHPERLLQQQRGRSDEVDLRPGFQPARRTTTACGRTTRRASPGRRRRRTSSRSRGTNSPCAGRAPARRRSAARRRRRRRPEADGHGEFSPQRVQTARWTSPLTNRLLLEAGLGNTYYQWGDRELDPNPTENLIRVTENQAVINPQGTVGPMTYRSQNWLINQTDGANWFFNALVCHRRRTA